MSVEITTKKQQLAIGIVLTLTLTMVLGLPATASAQPTGLYIAPKIGYSHLKADTDGRSYEDGHSTPDWINYSNGNHSKGQLALGLAVGYDFKPTYDIPIRTEFEYTWRSKKEMFKVIDEDTETFKARVKSFFVNAYFDIHNSTPVTPYVGAGLGVSKTSFAFRVLSSDANGEYDDTISGNETNFAWNIGAGVAWEITDSVALDLGYRYADFGKSSAEVKLVDTTGLEPWDTARDVIKADLRTHEVLLGLRYTF